MAQSEAFLQNQSDEATTPIQKSSNFEESSIDNRTGNLGSPDADDFSSQSDCREEGSIDTVLPEHGKPSHSVEHGSKERKSSFKTQDLQPVSSRGAAQEQAKSRWLLNNTGRKAFKARSTESPPTPVADSDNGVLEASQKKKKKKKKKKKREM